MPIEVGVIGNGHLGQHHTRIYSEIEGCHLAGIADIDKERVDQLAALYNTVPYTDYRELITRVDAVSIAVPTSLHHEVAEAFLCAGKDCLVEKPITTNNEQGEHLCQLARERGLILQVGHLERYNPAILSVEARINQPMFIESHRLAPFVSRGTDVDVVLDLMIHDIDIILSLVRSKVEAIDAVGVPVITSRIDIANARLTFESGCVANVTSSRVSMKKERKIRIFQKDAYFSIDYANSKVKACQLLPRAETDPGNFSKEVVQEEIQCPKEEPLKAELIDFLDAVRHRKRPKVSGEDGLEALRIAEKIKDAIPAQFS